MTNNMTRREARLAAQGYSTRELDEERENATTGSHFANALAFIVDSLADDETPVFNTSDFENNIDPESIMEFAEMYNFTLESFHKALEYFQRAVHNETHNAFYNGDCRNCMENPPTFN